MENKIKTYPAPWNGRLILACRKCQKKLKGDPDLRELARLKKVFKRHNKKHAERPLYVLDVPCMDLCPKNGVTLCDPAKVPNRLFILSNVEDIQAILQ